MKQFFAAISATLAATPGVAVILFGIGAPPESKGLLGGITEAIGGIVLLAIYVNRKKIMRISKRCVNKTVMGLVIVSTICLGLYIGLLKHCVINHPTHHSIYFPIFTTGHMSEIITREGGRYRALDVYGNHTISTELLSMPSYGILIALTTLLFIVFQQGIANTLVAVFALLSVREGVPLVSEGRRQEKPKKEKIENTT